MLYLTLVYLMISNHHKTIVVNIFVKEIEERKQN